MTVYVLIETNWSGDTVGFEIYKDKDGAILDMNRKVDFQVLGNDDIKKIYRYKNGLKIKLLYEDGDTMLTYRIEERKVK